MNLQNTIEGHPYAFFLVCIFLTLTMISLFVAFTSKYYQLKADTSSAQSFTLLRNFFSYVDDWAYIYAHIDPMILSRVLSRTWALFAGLRTGFVAIS